ncbi:MAG: 2-iminoacetate synthase ThiH [Carboxydocellales bacterium]
MSFYNDLSEIKKLDFPRFFAAQSKAEITKILQKSKLTAWDYLALLSPVAEDFLEEMAQTAHQLTVQNFGKTILLYTPMYLSNYCTNQCLYCGFSTKNILNRKQLSLAEVAEEAKGIAAMGLKHILILTGDAKGIASIEYIKSCVHMLRSYFPSISIEIYALEEEEYRELIITGVDSLTIYQETYNEDIYEQIHLKGPKKDYRYRLDAPERACRAGIRFVNIGALLGLDDWRKEAFLTGLHANYLQNNYPEVEISISLPRLRPHLGSFQPKDIVTDKNMVQFMVALRLFMPRAGITISTRERAEFRNNLLPLGVTKMSAASSTVVGGHTNGSKDSGQFEISDERNVDGMWAAISALGYQPVFKDWEPI